MSHFEDLLIYITNERLDSTNKNLYTILSLQLRKGDTIVKFPSLQYSKQIFALGSNPNGALGKGDQEESKTPTKIKQIKDIICFGCGGDHAHVSTKNGFFSWGSGRYYQIGDGNNVMRTSPVEVTALRNVKVAQIACSYSHTVVLTDTGKVFVWGSSTTSYGALGFGDDIVQTPYPKHLEMLDKMQIRRIFCGKSSCFTFALTAHGDMYAWGQNSSGQLGFGDTKRRSKPQLSDKIRRIAHMATGLAQVIAVDTEGLMFSWGGNRYGLLGYDTNSEDQLLPREITSMRRKDIIKVECTDTLVFALSRSGQVYVWGKMDLASTLKQELTKISVTNITCGRNHVILTTDDGTLYGYDPFGNSAIPRPQQDKGLTKLNVKYKHVIAGDSFTFMLTD